MIHRDNGFRRVRFPPSQIMNVNIQNIDFDLYIKYKKLLTKKGIKITVFNKKLLEDAMKKFIEENKS